MSTAVGYDDVSKTCKGIARFFKGLLTRNKLVQQHIKTSLPFLLNYMNDDDFLAIDRSLESLQSDVIAMRKNLRNAYDYPRQSGKRSNVSRETINHLQLIENK